MIINNNLIQLPVTFADTRFSQFFSKEQLLATAGNDKGQIKSIFTFLSMDPFKATNLGCDKE